VVKLNNVQNDKGPLRLTLEKIEIVVVNFDEVWHIVGNRQVSY
jgi:hypothetical protein